MKPLFAIILGSLTPFLLVSCFPKDLTGDAYSRDEVGQAQQIRRGTVESVRYVEIQAGQGAGSTIGAIAGGIAGSTIGSGSGRTLGVLGGAAAGSVAGGAVQQTTGNRQGVEITVKFDDSGESEAFVQQHAVREPFNVGDRVKVLYGSGRVRVTH